MEASNPVLARSEVVLSIYNQRYLESSDLGELLTALSRDYRQISGGRKLAVTDLNTGTTHITFTDALIAAMPYLVEGTSYLKESVEIIKGGRAIVQFVQSIRDLITKRKKEPNHDPRQGAWQSIEAMVKIAAKNGCDLQVRHSARDGETLEVRLTPADAQLIRERARKTTEKHKPASERGREAQALPASEVKFFADEIEQLARPGMTDFHILLSAVVRLLFQTGNAHLVELIAQELEARGYTELAAALRHEGQKR